MRKFYCIVSSGGGAGGMYTNFDFNGKTYSFEGGFDESGDVDWYGEYGKVESYLRDGSFYHEVSADEAEYAQHLLYCYRSQDGRVDVCSK